MAVGLLHRRSENLGGSFEVIQRFVLHWNSFQYLLDAIYDVLDDRVGLHDLHGVHLLCPVASEPALQLVEHT